MKLNLSILLLFLFSYFSNAQEQQLSSEAEISVLTIGPGSSLNDSFGHSAFRVKDKEKYLDVVFNYGVYDFDTPNFYLKFAQGKLNYKLATNSYSDFFEYYVAQNRTVKEQILNLSQSEKLQLFDFLLNNAKPKNRYYLYDFFYDNCATRIKDVINNGLNDHLIFSEPEGFTPKTFRQLIHSHLNQNSWGSLGIDVALGSVIDKRATAEEHMFLPKFIYIFFETATFSNSSKPLVKQSRVLFKKREKSISSSFLTSPLMIFGVIGLILLIITYRDYKNGKQSKWLDIVLFAITGLIGVFILLLWFATDHSATANNYNLLWAFPINLFVISQLYKKSTKKWFIKYLKFLVILFCLMILHWIIGIQVFAIGLIPLLFSLLVRYIFLVNYFSKKV
jgi:Domain of unknown function (DUF4105)